MELISFSNLERSGLKMPENQLLKKLLFRYLKVERMNRLYRDKLKHCQGIHFVDGLLQTQNMHVEVPVEELKNIPEKGPFIVMANHPFGFLDGLTMIQLMAHHFPNFKVLANYFLGEFEPIKEFFIPLNPFTSKVGMNISGLKTAMRHLSDGYPLGIFPSGEVATMQKGFGKVEDKEWDVNVVRFMLKSNVPIVPFYFFGQNSLNFHLLGKIHPYLRTLSIPAEFFKKEGQTVRLRIGKPIMPGDLKAFENNEKAGRFLRTCLSALERHEVKQRFSGFNLRRGQKPEPIIDPVPTDEIIRELEVLKANGGLLFAKSNYEIYLGKTTQIPVILREIGRLREVTFRQVGEGTNKKIDLDSYDTYYHHLFAFDTDTGKIIGAYRLGRGDEIVPQNGKKGFYVQSLFDLDEKMKLILTRTLELGRSFVVREYQQKPMPLFLLWQGILHFLKANPAIGYIMGPVSISNDFSGFSKDLIIAFIRKNYFDHDLAKWVYPKKEFKVTTNAMDIDVVLEHNSNDLQKLDKFISGIEPNALKIPVLLKQYIRQNAKIIGFNVDPDFNDCLDGLMVLNLNDLPKETLSFLQSR
ncbi:MAG: GNAT family N-acyltransferase [Breznakibacter sp.]